jgi:hypothetical protein
VRQRALHQGIGAQVPQLRVHLAHACTQRLAPRHVAQGHVQHRVCHPARLLAQRQLGKARRVEERMAVGRHGSAVRRLVAQGA